mmetsp:Transcript_12477/g.15644  ORF Transcript_12477/g.15644 Transcript_12477/m.15644 type:complete len:236 (+) Transcript_12477:187-894(+)|eukprot:CAMPEP_0172510788 /NCGR_PEP_ID=MMETSP1066-20121228/231338_1 /TAXON_ID=671091 /ORGANISM="Coscinodiscus wailesii, Strain CCMP2513" /LENGTH=235 /DNA_ID=CAMNT_0013289917 /DNA_START=164 /DNA_END=871 /DNA_ORIENTATION=+
MADAQSSSAHSYHAPPDDVFELDLMDIPDDIGPNDSSELSSYEIEDVMVDLDGIEPEELSTWLDQELDEEEAKFFESVESADEMEDQDDISLKRIEDTGRTHRAASARMTGSMYAPTGGTDGAFNSARNPTIVAPPLSSNGKKDFSPEQYSEALTNLASSMRRTEMSRAELLRQRSNMTQYSQAPQQMVPLSAPPSAMNSLTGLLTGKRSTLTVGLEQSRKQLREYMTRMNYNAL